MSADESAEVQIIVGSADISADVVWNQTSFTSVAAAQPGTCHIVVRSGDYVFQPGRDQIQLRINGERAWWGYLFTIDQGYFFEASPDPKFVLSGVDLNILFDKLILYNHDYPQRSLDGGGTFKRVRTEGGYIVTIPKSTWDREYIAAMLLDTDIWGVSPEINVEARVNQVGQFNPDGHATTPSPGLTLRAFFQDVSANVQRSEPGSSIWYIDHDAYLVYMAQDVDYAPFSVGDDEGGVNPKGLYVTTDISHIKNDVLVFSGNLSPLPGSTQSTILFVRNSLSASTGLFGHFQYSEVMTSDWTQGAINARSTKLLYQEGGPTLRADFTVFRHGLRPGQIVTISSGVHTFRWFDTTRGVGTDLSSYLVESSTINIPIRSIEMTFPTPNVVAYRASCSADTQDPWGLLLAMKRPATRGLSVPGYRTINRLKTPPDPLEPGVPYTLVKEIPRPMGGGVWKCSYAYIRDSITVWVNGLRRVGLPEGEGSTVGFIETDPNQGLFKIDSGTPHVEYHVWHGPLVDEA